MSRTKRLKAIGWGVCPLERHIHFGVTKCHKNLLLSTAHSQKNPVCMLDLGFSTVDVHLGIGSPAGDQRSLRTNTVLFAAELLVLTGFTPSLVSQ